ncbi:MAG: hypothetical protein ABIG95_01215 [Candidatus Woesearchaeota archaeon]
MKKADLSIQFIFLIFIATIAAVVIIGLLSNWAFDLRGAFDDFFDNSRDEVPDQETINLTNCNKVNEEIVKHAKLCYVRSQQGLINGDLCYAIIMPSTGCAIDKAKISDPLIADRINNSITASQNVFKVIISFDDSPPIVRIY